MTKRFKTGLLEEAFGFIEKHILKRKRNYTLDPAEYLLSGKKGTDERDEYEF